MRRAAALLASAAAAAANTVDVTLTDCCDASCKAKISKLTPPAGGKCQTPGSCSAGGTGALLEAVTSASLQLEITVAGVPVSNKKADACGDMSISLPLGLGTVAISALKSCPAASGDAVNVVVDVDNKIQVPSVIKAHAVATDQTGATLLCLDMTFTPEKATAAAALAHPEWEAWKARYGKAYSAEENARRAAVFADNMAAARVAAAAEPLAEFGASPYADLTAGEFAAWHSSGAFYASANTSHLAAADEIAADAVAAAAAGSVDWREKGAVTAVKNQKQCGSCWAFSTTGNVEGQAFLAGHPLTPLSEQQLIACDKGFGDQGCMGGLPSNAYKYIAKAGGLESEADYPLTSTLPVAPFAKCKFAASKVATSITGGLAIKSDEAQMLAWLTKNGPISIGVNAAGSTWQLYKGGIVTNCAVKQPDHGVLIVGYGEDAGQKYWIVKNSWAASWGEDGYVRLGYGTNQCNIVSTPTSSVVSKAI